MTKSLNPWIKQSLALFSEENYLDQLLEVYPFQVATPIHLDPELRHEIFLAHTSHDTEKLIGILKTLDKFPYEEPIWYLIKKVKGCFENNPRQLQRIANSLYSMTAEELIVRLEAAPKINTQMGPMFTKWLATKYESVSEDEFIKSESGIILLNAKEEVGRKFVNDILKQSLPKRPDLLIKVKSQYIIGEAKWIGQPGGNQEKQVGEVLTFCAQQRANVLRVGIVDGFPWSTVNINSKPIKSKEAINIQNSPYNIVSSLLLDKFLGQFL